jgi:ferredoxin/flavodoxin
MMKVIHIYYFSGTGNTAWVVRQLTDRLTALGDVAHGFSCEEIDPRDNPLLSCDVLGLAFPVHGSWAPRVFREFLANLPPMTDVPLFAVACAAYAAGDAAWYAVRPLADKGYVPFLYANVFMPNNLLFPVPKPEQVTRIVERARQKIEYLAPLIHEQQRHIEGLNPMGWLIGVIQRPPAEPVERWMSRHLFVDESCTHCGWCAEHCPVGNIALVGEEVHFGDSCIHCLRCFHQCPQQAVQWTNLSRNRSVFRRYRGPNGRYHPPVHAVRRRNDECM